MRFPIRLMAIVLTVGLVAVACGDDEATTTTTTEAPSATTTTEAPAPMDIVDTAIEAGQFSTLVAAVQAAGLVETLKGEGPYTVFAPTDEAFAAALDALGLTPEELLADTETLTDILLYHVVPGAVYAADVAGLESATTAQGSDIAITIDGETVMINDATVVAADIEASNGVIHVIDSVLLPPAVD
jgi:uncharacterized surface protein with fasciclin (FAS1) repeats